jgi:hypothetical protein
MYIEQQTAIDNQRKISAHLEGDIAILKTLKENFTREFRSLLVGMPDIPIIEVNWSIEKPFIEYAKYHNSLNLAVHQATKLGITEALGQITPDDSVVEFGTGQGLVHPIDATRGTHFLAIEPNQNAVLTGISEGRLPPDLFLISDSKPPYKFPDTYPLPKGIFSISAFHVLTNISDLVSVLEDLSANSETDAPIVHIQHTTPSAGIFQNLSDTELSAINQIFIQNHPKLPLTYSPNQKISDNLISKIIRDLYRDYKDMQYTIFDSSGKPIRKVTSPYNQMNYANSHLDALTNIAPAINLNKPNCGPLPTVQSLANEIANYLIALSNYDIKTNFQHTMNYIHSLYILNNAAIILKQELFESILKYAYEKAGLSFRADRFSICIPKGQLSVNIDGINDNVASRTYGTGLFGSVRRVIGRKIQQSVSNTQIQHL